MNKLIEGQSKICRDNLQDKLKTFGGNKMQCDIKNGNYFMKTERIGFSRWQQKDIKLAKILWGNPQVTQFICASGKFSENDIISRLNKEIDNDKKYHVQYWPVFDITSDELIGCCGLRPYAEKEYEIGIHLRPEFWGRGYAIEAMNAVINYAFMVLKADHLFAGHNPNNTASKKLLNALGFVYIRDEFYEPTGLFHPSYELKRE